MTKTKRVYVKMAANTMDLNHILDEAKTIADSDSCEMKYKIEPHIKYETKEIFKSASKFTNDKEITTYNYIFMVTIDMIPLIVTE